MLPDQPVQMDVDEVQPGRRAPVAEQPRLDVIELERRGEQRVVEEIDLPDRQVVGRAPLGVDAVQLVLAKHVRHGRPSRSAVVLRASTALPGAAARTSMPTLPVTV
jgi:hypothetical protein